MGITISDNLPNFNKIWDCINFLTVSAVNNAHNIRQLSQLIPNKIPTLFELQIAVQIVDRFFVGKKLNPGMKKIRRLIGIV